MIRTNPMQWSAKKLKRKTLEAFQRMIRAEAAASIEPVEVVLGGEITTVDSPFGMCRCVTCGEGQGWDSGRMDAGHYLAGKVNAVCLDHRGCHPQCTTCNNYKSGNAANYEIFMRHVYGQKVIDELKLRSNLNKYKRSDRSVVQVTLEWVDIRLVFMSRASYAIEAMVAGDPSQF